VQKEKREYFLFLLAHSEKVVTFALPIRARVLKAAAKTFKEKVWPKAKECRNWQPAQRQRKNGRFF
jgi:hypothetical protein